MTEIVKAQDVLKKVNQYAKKNNIHEISKTELTEKVNQLIDITDRTKFNLQIALTKIYHTPALIFDPTPPIPITFTNPPGKPYK